MSSEAEPRRKWLGAALPAALAYAVIGKTFAMPAEHVQAWRLAAWVASGIVFAAQIVYEHVALRSSPGRTASHAAVAAALGAFALAIAGPLHFFLADIRRTALLALVIWPVITAIPAFLVGAVAAFALRHLLPRASP